MKITLRNIKKITELPFDMPARGVWVLTGLNGSGKTSLFAAIYRIGAQHAFQRFYKTSPLEHRLDSYANAEVEYQINGETVRYHYGGQRWRATPSRNSKLFTQSPYDSIIYIEASGDRIEPFADEIQPRRLRDVDIQIKEFLVNVLSDTKWNNLKHINTRRGTGNDAYLIQYQVQGRNFYFSEKSFSLGELCTLKLALKVSKAPDNSLILIDEVEMALHPQAQVKLLNEITRITNEKRLTVLFSTHSATIIKNTPRKKIIHLKNNNGAISPIVGAFPAQVLGDIAFDDELTTDFVFYVEDKQAKLLMEQLINMYMAYCHPNNNYRPLYKVVPVGGFVQVVEMLNTSSTIFANYVKRYAFLDEDVKTEALVKARRDRNQSLIELFEAANDKAKFLPCTPEVGIIDMLENNLQNNPPLLQQLNSMFDGHFINLVALTSSADYLALTAEKIRERSKDRMTNLVNNIKRTTGIDEVQVRRIIYSQYCKFKYENNIGELRQLLSPVFNAR